MNKTQLSASYGERLVTTVSAEPSEAVVQTTAPGPCAEVAPFPFVWSLDRSTTVGRALLAASRRLRETGSDTPQLDSAVLMAYVLGVGKTWLYGHPNRALTEDEITRFETLVRRRMHHEPVAYLVGYKAFFGLDITVDERVLIPRPETELLVERVLGHARQLAGVGITPRIADIGTGSGAISVALAVNLPASIIYATDISDAALAVAAQNVWRYGVGSQVQLLPGNLMEPVPEAVDIVVANLPYIAWAELPKLPCEVREHEPVRALDGGVDGVRVIGDLLASLADPAVRERRLRPDGCVYLEIGAGQGEAVRNLAQQALPGCRAEVHVDYAGLERVVTVSL